METSSALRSLEIEIATGRSDPPVHERAGTWDTKQHGCWKACIRTTMTRASALASDRRGQVGARERSLPLWPRRHDGRAEEDPPCSASINSYAVPLLVSETLQAQSANINLVSGATDTSEAYLQSLQDALSAAGI
jgi:hypothetical protein